MFAREAYPVVKIFTHHCLILSKNNFFYIFFLSCFYIGLCRQGRFKTPTSVAWSSFPQPQELVSARAKRACKLLVITGTNKPFDLSQPYFTRDGKHCDGIYELCSTIVAK